MMAFEIVEFLNDLGSIPVFIQERELCEQYKPFKENLLKEDITHM